MACVPRTSTRLLFAFVDTHFIDMIANALVGAPLLCWLGRIVARTVGRHHDRLAAPALRRRAARPEDFWGLRSQNDDLPSSNHALGASGGESGVSQYVVNARDSLGKRR